MLDQLATDPGAWNIIGWMVGIVVVGSLAFWAITNLLLRSRKDADTARVHDRSNNQL